MPNEDTGRGSGFTLRPRPADGTRRLFSGSDTGNVRFGYLLSDALSDARRLLPLALVPLAATLARWSEGVAVATDTDERFSLRFGLPHPTADLQTFIDPLASDGGGLRVDAPFVAETGSVADSFALSVVALSVAGYVLLTGVLTAGYLGSIDQFLASRRHDFTGNVGRYALRMVALGSIPPSVLADVGYVGVPGAAALSSPLGLFPTVLSVGFTRKLLFGAGRDGPLDDGPAGVAD